MNNTHIFPSHANKAHSRQPDQHKIIEGRLDQKDDMVSHYPTRLARNAYVHNFTQGSSECAIVVVQEKHPGEVASLLVGLQAVTKVEHRSPSPLHPDQNKIGSALSWESNNKRNYMATLHVGNKADTLASVDSWDVSSRTRVLQQINKVAPGAKLRLVWEQWKNRIGHRSVN